MTRDELIRDDFPTAAARDLAMHFIGKQLGHGQFRNVFAWDGKPKDTVVKIERYAGSFSNVHEWQVWRAAKDAQIAQWFAPCLEISPNGVLLWQARTQPVDPADLPDKVPAFFTDLKPSNWGRLGKRIVCHDYGNHLMLEKGMTKRMRRADWREH